MAKAVGIDLGTTNSVISIMEGGAPIVLESAEGERTTPSVVAFKGEENLVGRIARRQAALNATGTVFEIKRFIGRRWDEVQEESKRTPYKVVQGPDGGVRVDINGKLHTPEELSAMILRKLADDASKKLGERVTKAVITVPAYFNNAQREATANAGKIAGLEVLRIVNEPTAAALAYGLDKKGHETVLVFDLGGGTFDVTVLEIGDGVFEVKSTAGDTHLGGSDMDHLLVNYIAEEYKKESGTDIRKNPQSLQRLIEAAEKAKIELSSTTQAVVSLPFIGMNPVTNTPLNLEMTITRGKFEELIQPLLKRIRGPVEQALRDAGLPASKIDEEPVEQALRDAGLPASKIDEVLLVGGSTRVPAVQQIVKDMLGQEPNRTVNPDEVVALGAAVQAGVLTGTVEDVVLLDVTPLSLSVETKGGVATPLIPRNTTVPTRKSEIFTTAEHNQPSVEIHILQGERPMAMDNKSLGRFRLDSIPAMMAGMPQIEVTFDIDANGILHASAKEKSTGKEQSITIQNTTTLSEQEIDRMVKDAEANAEADRKRKEHVELKNTLDSARIRAEQVLQEKQSTPEAKSSLEAAVARAKDLVGRESGDDDLRSATEQLMQALQMYEQGATQATADSGNAGATTSANKPDDVIDADFKPAD